MRRPKNKRHQAILLAIIEAPVACVPVQELARRVGVVREVLEDSLATLEAEHWIETWEERDGISVTLTSYAASAYRVELIEYGRSGTLRWKSVDDPMPVPRSRGARGGDDHVDFFESIPDPAPPPDIAAELAETPPVRPAAEPAKRDGKIDFRDFPAPTIFLGMHHSPFPGPKAEGRDRTCPVCGSSPRCSRVLNPRAYCLWCDRWGQDAAVAAALPSLRAGVLRPIAPRRDENQLERLLRDDRKRKRRLKHEEKWSPRSSSPAKRPAAPGRCPQGKRSRPHA